MSSMEPSLQPSFTFPSRHDLQNYAKGIIDLSSSTQRLLVRPKQNTDINIETAFQNPLTIAKTLDKDVIDVKAVIPVDTNIYVQPGLAEGMTNLAKMSNADKDIMSVTSANNALKRGNYKAAEKLIGRAVTTEEMSNRTVTPETRSSESNPNIKTGVAFNDIAFGAQLDRNSQYNFHQREKMLREAEPYLTNAVANHLGVSPSQVSMLKTTMGYTGDSVLGFYRGHPRAQEEILNQFKYAWEAMKAGKSEEGMRMRAEAEGTPLHSGARAAKARRAHIHQRYETEPARTSYDPNGNGDENYVPVAPDPDAFQPPPFQPNYSSIGFNDTGLGPKVPFVTQADLNRGTWARPQPYEGFAEDNPMAGVEYTDPSLMEEDEKEMPGGQMELENLDTRQLKAFQVTQYPRHDPQFRGSSLSPGEQLAEISVYGQPVMNGGGPPIIHPQVLEQVVVNAPMETFPDENEQKMRLLQEVNVPHADENMGYFPPDDVHMRNEPAGILDVDIIGMDMEEGKKASIRQREALEQMTPRQREVWRRRNHRMLEQYFARPMERKDHMEEEEFGSGMGRRHRTMKRKRFSPYERTDSTMVPQTDGFYGPAGGVISGKLMSQTGRNAVPLSAQIQVQNTHQWTETPLQEWVKHPNYATEVKPKPIPISQNTGHGVPRRARKVEFGDYVIDHHKLMTGGVLSVSHKSGKKVKGMPNQEVSSGFKEVIHSIITGDKVNTKKLSAQERLQLGQLLHRSAADVVMGADVNVSPTQKLSLILGEIEAGNDSQDLKSQLKKLLPALKRGKCITAEQASDISKHYL